MTSRPEPTSSSARQCAHEHPRARSWRFHPLRHGRLRLDHLLGVCLRQVHVRHVEDSGGRPVHGRRLLERLQVVLKGMRISTDRGSSSASCGALGSSEPRPCAFGVVG